MMEMELETEMEMEMDLCATDTFSYGTVLGIGSTALSTKRT